MTEIPRLAVRETCGGIRSRSFSRLLVALGVPWRVGGCLGPDFSLPLPSLCVCLRVLFPFS